MNILRKISFALTETIITVIPSVYNIFERIGSHEFFSSEAIQNISNNIYILVSVCMLFAFGIKLLNTIVNPDIIDDKKKGTKKTFINGVIAVVLISVVPFLFDILYKVQFQVLGTDEQTGEHHNLIQKIVFGTDGEYDSGSLRAGYTFAAFCYPNETVSNTGLTVQGGNYYNKVTRGEIQYIDKVGDAINDEINGEYELNYHIILAPLAGGYVLYQVILMCIDIAFRSVKLGILQLMAPLVICAFIFAGTDMLTRWIKEVISTYVIVFVKVAAITFMVYALSLLPDLFDRLGLVDSTRDSWAAKGFIRVAFLIGLLQLVKKLPEIINKIFGTSLDTNGDGGIRGRLGAMAGVGAAAQRAWDALRTHPIQTAMKPVGAVAGVGANIANRGIEIGRRINEASVGAGVTNRGLRYGAAILGGIAGGVASGTATSIGAARRGWQNGLRAPGQEAQFYRDTHQPGSTFGQRTLAGAARTLGFRTPYERAGRNDDIVEWRDAAGNNHRMTVEQLKALQEPHQALTTHAKTLRDQIAAQIDREQSNVQLGDVTATVGGIPMTFTGNAHQIKKQIETFAQNRPAGMSEDDHRAYVSQFETAFANQRDAVLNNATQDVWSTGTFNFHDGTGTVRELTGIRLQDAQSAMAEVAAIFQNNDDLRNYFAAHGRTATIGPNGTISFTGANIMDAGTAGSVAALNNDRTTEYNSALINHQAAINARKNSQRDRDQQASQQSVDNRRNNGGGGNAGGGH